MYLLNILHRWWFYAVLLGGMLFFLSHYQSLAGDEIATLRYLHGDLDSINQAPLYFKFISLWTAIFGESQIALRLPSVIFMLLAFWSFTRLAALFKLPVNGFYFLIILNPQILRYGVFARCYSMYLFLALEVFIQLIRILQDKKVNYYAIGICSASLVLLHNYGIVFVTLVIIISRSALHLRGRSPWRLLLAFLPAVALILFRLNTVFTAVQSAEKWGRVEINESAYLFFREFVEYYFSHFFPLNILSAIIALVFIIFFIRDYHQKGIALALIGLLSLPALVFGWLYVHQLLFRYLIYMLPMFLLALVYGLRKVKRSYLQVLVVILFGTVFVKENLLINWNHGYQNWRDAVAYVESHASQEDFVVVFPHFMELGYTHYQMSDHPIITFPPYLHAQTMEGAAYYFEQCRVVWLVSAPLLEGISQDFLEAGGHLTKFKHFTNVEVFKFECEADAPSYCHIHVTEPTDGQKIAEFPDIDWQDCPGVEQYYLALYSPGQIYFRWLASESQFPFGTHYGSVSDVILDGKFRYRIWGMDAQGNVLADSDWHDFLTVSYPHPPASNDKR